MCREIPNGSYCNPAAALVPSRASNSSNSSSASRTARSFRVSGAAPPSSSNAPRNSLTASLGFISPPLVCTVHPVLPRRPRRRREINKLPTALRLEPGRHQVHQVVPAGFELVLRNREDKGVVNECLDRPENRIGGLQEEVASDLPRTRLPQQGRCLGEGPALFDVHLPSPVVHDVTARRERPDPVLPGHQSLKR